MRCNISRLLLAHFLMALPAAADPPSGPSTSQPAQAAGEVSLVPSDSDEYAKLVGRAESGATDVDFRAMRLAYIESAAFLRAEAARGRLQALRKEMFAGMRADDAERVRDSARRILNIVYIDLEAQKALQQSCKILKDEACASRYHDIEFGLLKSILATGDGKSCPTAWEVVRIEEEYFILRMRGFTLERQVGPSDSEICDQMVGVAEDGKPRTYFFGVKPIFQGYQRIFGPEQRGESPR